MHSSSTSTQSTLSSRYTVVVVEVAVVVDVIVVAVVAVAVVVVAVVEVEAALDASSFTQIEHGETTLAASMFVFVHPDWQWQGSRDPPGRYGSLWQVSPGTAGGAATSPSVGQKLVLRAHHR